jgi:phage shock protein C
MKKRIYRPTEGKIIGGVCAGLGEYFDVDPTWIRILLVLTIFAQGVGLLAYLVAWIVIPKKPEVPSQAVVQPTDGAPAAGPVPQPEVSSPPRGPSFLPGVILIGLGLVFLFDRVFSWFDFRYVWPLIIVGIGVVLIFHSVSPHKAASHSTQVVSDATEVNDDRR